MSEGDGLVKPLRKVVALIREWRGGVKVVTEVLSCGHRLVWIGGCRREAWRRRCAECVEETSS